MDTLLIKTYFPKKVSYNTQPIFTCSNIPLGNCSFQVIINLTLVLGSGQHSSSESSASKQGPRFKGKDVIALCALVNERPSALAG